MDDVREIEIGAQFLSASGRMWAVRAVTPAGDRVVLTSNGPGGEHGAVMDLVAVLRMVRIDGTSPMVENDQGGIFEAQRQTVGAETHSAAARVQVGPSRDG